MVSISRVPMPGRGRRAGGIFLAGAVCALFPLVGAYSASLGDESFILLLSSLALLAFFSTVAADAACKTRCQATDTLRRAVRTTHACPTGTSFDGGVYMTVDVPAVLLEMENGRTFYTRDVAAWEALRPQPGDQVTVTWTEGLALFAEEEPSVERFVVKNR